MMTAWRFRARLPEVPDKGNRDGMRPAEQVNKLKYS
jgi:hypothetical protein